MLETLKQISENWFLTEPAFFSLYCQQQLEENVKMDCAVRCGQGRLEYNPLLLKHKNYSEVEQLMRIELIRLFLKHPYERQPEGCSREAMAIGSNVTIADGYCVLHKDKLPLHDPSYYHLPLGQYYEWYAKQIQQQGDDQKDNNNKSGKSGDPQGHNENNDEQDDPKANRSKSELWREDALERQRINDLIDRTSDWGSIPADIVERIKASTKAKINNRLIWQGFHSSILSSQRCLTRMRPNRRTGFLQMGSTRQFDTRLLVAIDVSGSINDHQLADFYSSVNRVFRYGVVQIDTCQFDAQMGPVLPMTKASKEITVKGRGGTNFQPVFDYVLGHSTEYDGLILLTDGQGTPPLIPTEKHLLPVLWVTPDLACYQAAHDWMSKTGRVTYL